LQPEYILSISHRFLLFGKQKGICLYLFALRRRTECIVCIFLFINQCPQSSEGFAALSGDSVVVHFDALLHGDVDHAEGLCLCVDFLAAGDPPRSPAGHVARNRQGADELQEPRGFAWGVLVLDSPKQKKWPMEGNVFVSSCVMILD
jgi:hypothetical protein